jgi:hypothetical protein
MLQILLERKPDINLTCKDEFGYYPFGTLIQYVPIGMLYKYLSIIELAQREIQIDTNITTYNISHFLSHRINYITRYYHLYSDINPMELLVKISGELFILIEPDNQTLALANCFYNSAWLKSHEVEGINLIHEKFRPHLAKSGSKTKPGFRSRSPNQDDFDSN